jgi:hypothetical protein
MAIKFLKRLRPRYGSVLFLSRKLCIKQKEWVGRRGAESAMVLEIRRRLGHESSQVDSFERQPCFL